MRRFSRRPLLVTSSLCVALGMVLLGWSTHYNTTQVLYCTVLYCTVLYCNVLLYCTGPPTQEGAGGGFVANYLPLISVNFIAVAYQLGLGPVGWSYTAELFPVDMRAFLSGFCSFATNFYIFVVIKTFPECK